MMQMMYGDVLMNQMEKFVLVGVHLFQLLNNHKHYAFDEQCYTFNPTSSPGK